MALSRRSGHRFQASIWPGFVDAMTGLLLVLMFLLTIFMVVQSVLSDTISGQETELNQLSGEVAALAQALGMEQRDRMDAQVALGEEETRALLLQSDLGTAKSSLEIARSDAQAQSERIAALLQERATQDATLQARDAQITSFEAQVTALIADRNAARDQVAALRDEASTLMTQQEALNLSLAQARDEIDAQTEVARLAAARREAIEALVADLRSRNAQTEGQLGVLNEELAQAQTALTDEEAARLAEAAAAQALREKLQSAETELTAMTLSLESQRQEAEDTLTLLAAAQAAREQLAEDLTQSLSSASGTQDTVASLQEQLRAALAAKSAAEERVETELTASQQRAALLAQANDVLSEEQAASAASQRQMALLNQQVADLRGRLGDLQGLLDDAQDRDEAAGVQIEKLGAQLNQALARVAVEERKRRALEEAENEVLAAQKRELEEDRARLELEKAELEARKAELESQNTELESETETLARFRSEFFGRVRDILGPQEGVQISGDRFVFASEVLFAPGAADLSAEGQAEVTKVANILQSVAVEIPPEINWIIRVDGHTDNVPLSGQGVYANNWELSQARALSVVRFMSESLGINPARLAANGFGEWQPVATGDSPEARAQNRRIELKFTEK